MPDVPAEIAVLPDARATLIVVLPGNDDFRHQQRVRCAVTDLSKAALIRREQVRRGALIAFQAKGTVPRANCRVTSPDEVAIVHEIVAAGRDIARLIEPHRFWAVAGAGKNRQRE